MVHGKPPPKKRAGEARRRTVFENLTSVSSMNKNCQGSEKTTVFHDTNLQPLP